jgi:adenylate kinase family enzyme
MKRVVIIGSPGAGKTVLSRKLAEATHLPIVHLDRLYHQKAGEYERDMDAWARRVEKEVKKPRWIMEGNYKSTFSMRLPAADTIIYLDYPQILATWRVIKRRIQYHNKTRPEMPLGWKEKIDPAFFRYVVNFRRKQRPGMYDALSRHQSKNIVILKSSRQTEHFLSTQLKML